ncbi:LppX_LprAFG lipoprotein [Amycolatopsis sp. cg5]|uniref:LppX_LprAFG lipoprotein n=1 Tax=Amycolatopsis sp. cg5 TaxID=3238802 RepID=UPI0035236506
MFKRRTLLGALAVTAALVTGCSSDSGTTKEKLPEAGPLIADAAQAIGAVKSAHFTLKVNGDIAGLTVQSLDGDLTKEGGSKGGAKGTGKLSMLGQLTEVEFTLAGETLYIKGPTGSYQKVPIALGASIYDPSAVLDPNRGIAKVLTSVQNPKTEAKEDVNGTQAYKVTGKVTKDVLAQLLPGAPDDAVVSFWLAEAGKHLPVKATAVLPSNSSVDVTLSDVDKPVTITPPA